MCPRSVGRNTGHELFAQRPMPCRHTFGIQTIRKQPLRRWNAVVRDRCQAPHLGHRISDDVINRCRIISEAIDERRVGAVLQQTPHEISQQVFMAAHGCINPAGLVDIAVAHNTLIQRLAHAMEALEFIALVIPRHHRNRRYGVGIVSGELRIEHITPRQHIFCTSEIADIRRGLAREHGVILKPVLLRPLDFRIPIGTLDQSHWQYPTCALGNVSKILQDWLCASTIGLHGQTQTVPALEFRCRSQTLKQLQ